MNKFKVGDRVVYKPRGRVGTVNSAGRTHVAVRFDDGSWQGMVDPSDLDPSPPLFQLDDSDSIPDDDLVAFKREINSIIQGPQAMKLFPIKVESRFFVNGYEVTDFNDDDLFDMIRQSEAEIERLNALKNRPKALVNHVAELQAGIDELVKYMDSK